MKPPKLEQRGTLLAPDKTKPDSYGFETRWLRRNWMNNLLRGGLAGAAAYKFGGGIISMILIFVLVFWLLGSC